MSIMSQEYLTNGPFILDYKTRKMQSNECDRICEQKSFLKRITDLID